jgi:hypothetical protein
MWRLTDWLLDQKNWRKVIGFSLALLIITVMIFA